MKKLLLLLAGTMMANIGFGQVFDTVSYYKKYTPQQLHQDLDFLLQKFQEIHPDYFAETPRETVLKRYADVKARITKPMTRIDFMNLFAPTAYGVIKDGHNYVNVPEEDLKLYLNRGGKFFPLPVTISGGKLLVNSVTVSVPYHAEIISINNRPTVEVLRMVLSSYNPESNYFKESFLAGDFGLLYWLRYGSSAQFNITYTDSTGTEKKHMLLPANSPNDINHLIGGPKQAKKVYLFEKNNYAFYEMPQHNTGVLEYRACDDLENFRPFCDSVFTWMRHNGYKNLIIDIRNNVGGTTRLNDILFEYLTNKPITQYNEIDIKISEDGKRDFIEANRKYAGWFKWYHYLYYPLYIRLNSKRKQVLTAQNGSIIKQKFVPVTPKENPLRFEGNAYLLTSNFTYSSAAIFAAAFKCFHLGIVLGQETGEPTCFTGDWVGVTLPNTQLQCAISNKRFILACGKCDGNGVIPDHEIDPAKPADAAVAQVAALISGKK